MVEQCEVGPAWSDSVLGDVRDIAVRWRCTGRESLRPTLLVNELYVRLRAYTPPARGDHTKARVQFLALAQRAVRSIAIDILRRRRPSATLIEERADRALVADDPLVRGESEARFRAALVELATLDERKALVAELRWLLGLSVAQTAASLGVSERTIELDSRRARAWLNRRLSESP